MGWIELFVQKILPEVVGERAAPFVFAMIVAFVLMVSATPVCVLWIVRQVGRLRSSLSKAEAQLERLTQRSVETHSLVKESFTLVQDRLAGVPPPVRFGPESGGEKGAELADSQPGTAQPGTIPEGQGTYNYCPGCKEIRFIKFFRCQTCGFHVPR